MPTKAIKRETKPMNDSKRVAQSAVELSVLDPSHRSSAAIYNPAPSATPPCVPTGLSGTIKATVRT